MTVIDLATARKRIESTNKPQSNLTRCKFTDRQELGYQISQQRQRWESVQLFPKFRLITSMRNDLTLSNFVKSFAAKVRFSKINL